MENTLRTIFDFIVNMIKAAIFIGLFLLSLYLIFDSLPGYYEVGNPTQALAAIWVLILFGILLMAEKR